MNLLEESWLPVRMHDGSRERVSPVQLSDPRIAGFDADRADFNGALAQFAIGLLQTASPVDNVIGWRALLKAPPDQATLQNWFLPHSAAFEFDGDGARFMQDFELRAGDGDALRIGGLLIETPGENTAKNNTDHFIKRHQANDLCPGCVAMALFTLQTNAPAGGAGNRTGLRGGGPLTTLLVAHRENAGPLSLWHSLWLNVQERHTFDSGGGDLQKTAQHFIFPWTAGLQRLQKDGAETAPIQVSPSHVFWGMPRRIRIDFETVRTGICDLCGSQSDRLIHQYVARNHGLNYKGPWRHPLSPYYKTKEGMLPLHPQPGGLGYRHWLGWILGMQTDKSKVESAAVIQHFFEADVQRRTGIELRLWAFGYDMENMKARCWYEATVPIYALGECSVESQKHVRETVSAWLAGAELVAKYLRGAVKDARFGDIATEKFEFVDASFWSHTEAGFYVLLKARIKAARDGFVPDSIVLAESWLTTLCQAAEHLFDADLVGTGQIERENPARISKAHRQLMQSLRGPKLRTALALPVAAKPVKKSKSTAALAE